MSVGTCLRYRVARCPKGSLGTASGGLAAARLREEPSLTQVQHPPGLLTEWRLWWDYERGRLIGGGPIARIAQIQRRSNVLVELIRRGLQVQYRESFLGYAWSLLE